MYQKKPDGYWIGKKVSIEGEIYKIVFFKKEGFYSLGERSHFPDFCYLGFREDNGRMCVLSEKHFEKEPVEMTVAEICKALGKNIKIIK